MRTFLVYNLIFGNNNIEHNIVSQYTIESVAIKGIEKNALEYIKNKYGEYHLEKCIQYGKTIEEINNDSSIKEGGYLIKDGNKIKVLSKVKKQKEISTPVDVVKSVKIIKGVPEEQEFNIVEKVKQVSKKIVKEPISYFASFVVSPVETEIEEEIEVDQIVTKKLNLYVEKEITILEANKEYILQKVKSYETTCIGEFNITSIEVEDRIQIVKENTVNIIEKNIKENETLKMSYIEELTQYLENGIVKPSLTRSKKRN